MVRRVTVVGASLAGLSTVRALRGQGYDGEIAVIGAEAHLPYDRPPLSKGYLTGLVDDDAIALLGEGDAALDVQWRLGVAAVELRPSTRSIVLADGTEVGSDAVVLATGARPRTLPGAGDLTGVHALRSLDDAQALRRALQTAGDVVVVGAGFIGAEVASSARTLGLSVTVVEATPTPLAGPLGEQMGRVCAGLHADHDVALITGVGVTRLLGTNHVTGVELSNGQVLPADVVVVGIGVQPNSEWLAGSGIALDEGVLTDASCATSLPGVMAVGDCAMSFDLTAGRHLRCEHWTHALQQPTAAAATLLAGSSAAPYDAVPYFWSEQYGLHVQFAGHRSADDTVTVVAGNTEDRSFVASYERAGRLTAVLGVGLPGPFNTWRRRLRVEHAALVHRRSADTSQTPR